MATQALHPGRSRNFHHQLGRYLPPPSISLVHLPPYSPELNAIERVWQYLRDRYLSGRLFGGTCAIVGACCEAWNKLIAETGRIQSLPDFEWARQVSL